MTDLNETQTAATQELDEASLDLVTGGGVMVPDIVSPRDPASAVVVHEGR